MSDQLQQLAGALEGRYQIERELGRGGMARVYEAFDVKHQRRVAVKVLRPELAEDLGSERFLREITIAAQLNHPHILPLFDSGNANGLLYYVMPLVDGESLRARLDREKQLSIDDALELTQQIGQALDYAHSMGVIHRDIKPGNILLSGKQASIADFGVASAVDIAGGKQLTARGVAIGTPEYMSPEQGSGTEDLDRRTDIYSLGCVVYEMLVGEPPFKGTSARAILARHMMESPPSIRVVRPTVPL